MDSEASIATKTTGSKRIAAAIMKPPPSRMVQNHEEAIDAITTIMQPNNMNASSNKNDNSNHSNNTASNNDAKDELNNQSDNRMNDDDEVIDDIVSANGILSSKENHTTKTAIANQNKSEALLQEADKLEKAPPIVYGELSILGYNGYIPNVERNGRKNKSKYLLCKRSNPNGIKKSRHYIVKQPQATKAIQDKDLHSISFTFSRQQTIIVEYGQDEQTDMFQIGRSSEDPIDFVVMDTFTPCSDSSGQHLSGGRQHHEQNSIHLHHQHHRSNNTTSNNQVHHQYQQLQSSQHQFQLQQNPHHPNGGGSAIVGSSSGSNGAPSPLDTCMLGLTRVQCRHLVKMGADMNQHGIPNPYSAMPPAGVTFDSRGSPTRLAHFRRPNPHPSLTYLQNAANGGQVIDSNLRMSNQPFEPQQAPIVSSSSHHHAFYQQTQQQQPNFQSHRAIGNLDNIPSSSNPCQQSKSSSGDRHNMMCKRSHASQSTISRFACRILVDRKPPYVARIYAAGFDSSKNIFLGEKATKWEHNNSIDGLTTNGVLLMHPKNDQGDTGGLWREVSVDGGVYAIRESRSAAQKGTRIENESNILQDGTLIDLCGATLLWRSVDGFKSAPTKKTLEEKIDTLNASRPQCPVGLNTLVIPRKPILPNNHQHSRHSHHNHHHSHSHHHHHHRDNHQHNELSQQISSNSEIINSHQPYVYLKCGHVQGYHKWGATEKSNQRTCPICLSVGTVAKLSMGLEPSFYIDSGPLSHVFNPCGHMASEKTVSYWCSVKIPHGTHFFHSICPFCATPLATDEPASTKLIFQDDCD